MNQTEAWETVLEAARQYAGRVDLINHSGKVWRLSKALEKVTPRVSRMRTRLNTIRATAAQRRKTAKGMPAWLEKATR